MLTKKERRILRRAKETGLIYTNIKSGIKSAFEAFWMSFVIDFILLVIGKRVFLLEVIMVLAISVVVYFVAGAFFFKSLMLFLKLLLVYLRINIRKLFLFVFGK